MKRKTSVCLLALALSAMPGFANAAGEIELLADASGMSERHVRMLFGPRTPYSEYRASGFRWIEQEFIAAVGEKQYRALLAGKPVRLQRQVDGRTVAVVVRLEPRG
jgi:hypothetical protein